MPETLFVSASFEWRVQLWQICIHSEKTWNITLLTPFYSHHNNHAVFVTTIRSSQYEHVFLCSNFAPQHHKVFRFSLQALFHQPVDDNENDNAAQSYDVAIHAHTSVDVHERYTDTRFHYLDNVSDGQLVTALFDCAIAHCQSETRRIFFASDSDTLIRLAVEHGKSRNLTVFSVGQTSNTKRRTEEETRRVAAKEWRMLTNASVAVVTTKSAFSTSAFAMSDADKPVHVRAWKKSNKKSRCEVVFDHGIVG